MIMTAAEIVADYRQAKDPKKQISVLAELNLCSKSEIADIIEQETGTHIDRRGIGKREPVETTEKEPKAAIKPNSDHEAVHNTITLNPEEAEQLAKFLADALPAYIHRLAKTDLLGINTLTGIYRRCLNA